MSLLIVCFVIIAVVYIKEYKSFNRSLLSVLGDRQREASQSGKRPSRHKKKPTAKAPGKQLDEHMREFRDDFLMFEQLPETEEAVETEKAKDYEYGYEYDIPDDDDFHPDFYHDVNLSKNANIQ